MRSATIHRLGVLIALAAFWGFVIACFTGCANVSYHRNAQGVETFAYTTVMQDATDEDLRGPNGIGLKRKDVSNAPVSESVDRLASLAQTKALIGLGGEALEETGNIAEELTD